jgi:hypothetical protein
MDEVERLFLRSCLEEGRCPACGAPIRGGEGVGSGSLDDGLFCRLECFASYHYPSGQPRLETEIQELRPDGDPS